MFDKSIPRENISICKMKTTGNPAAKLAADLGKANMKSVYDLLENNLDFNLFSQTTQKCKIMNSSIPSSQIKTVKKKEADKITSAMEKTEEKYEVSADENEKQNVILSKNVSLQKFVVHQSEDGTIKNEDGIVKKEDGNSSCLVKMQRKPVNDEDSVSENESDDNDERDDNISNVDSQNDIHKKDYTSDTKERETTQQLLKANTSESAKVEEQLTRLVITPAPEESKEAGKKDDTEDLQGKLLGKLSLKLNIPANIPAEPLSELEEKLKKLTINKLVKEIKETGELIKRSPMKGHVRPSTKPYAVSSHALQSGGGIIAHIPAASPVPHNTYLQPNVDFNISPFSPANSPESNILGLPPSPQFPFVQELCQSEAPLRELTTNDIDEVLFNFTNKNSYGEDEQRNRSDAVVPSMVDEDSLLDYITTNSPESLFPETLPAMSSTVTDTTAQQPVSDGFSSGIESLSVTYRQQTHSFAGSISSPGTTFSSSGSPFPSDSSSPVNSPVPSPPDSCFSTSELGRSVKNLLLPTLSEVSDNSNSSGITTDDSSSSSGIYPSINTTASIINSQLTYTDNNENSCSSFGTEIVFDNQIYSLLRNSPIQNNENMPETQFVIKNDFVASNGQSSDQLQFVMQPNGVLIQQNELYQILSTTQNDILTENSQSLQQIQPTATNINSFTHSSTPNTCIQQHKFLSPNISVGSTNSTVSASNSRPHVVSVPQSSNIHVRRIQGPVQSSSVQAQPVQNQIQQLQQTVPVTNLNSLPNYTVAMPVVLQNVTNAKSTPRPLVAIQKGSYIPNIQPKSAKERFPEKLNPSLQLKIRVKLAQLSDELLTEGDNDGDTQLLIAVSKPNQENRKEYVYELINRIKHIPGALNARNNLNQSALLLASLYLAKEPLIARFIAETLIDSNINVDETYNDGNSVIHHLCKKGESHLNVLIELLSIRDSKGMPYFDINRYNHKEGSPLHTAVKSHSQTVDCKSTVRFLLSQGANVLDKERCSGQTALHIAIREACCPEMVRILLQDSASRNVVIVNEKDYGGDMPLHYAASRNDVPLKRHAKVLELLMQYGAIGNRTGSRGKMPLALVSAERKNVRTVIQ